MPRGGNVLLNHNLYTLVQKQHEEGLWLDGFTLDEAIFRMKNDYERRYNRTYTRKRIPTKRQLSSVLSASPYFKKIGVTRTKSVSSGYSSSYEVNIWQIKPMDEIMIPIEAGKQTVTQPRYYPKFLKQEIERRKNDEQVRRESD
tara:strand:- start:944 stop:1375 length:432 start_codon:yes stop_codon:yes gene_type:complete